MSPRLVTWDKLQRVKNHKSIRVSVAHGDGSIAIKGDVANATKGFASGERLSLINTKQSGLTPAFEGEWHFGGSCLMS